MPVLPARAGRLPARRVRRRAGPGAPAGSAGAGGHRAGATAGFGILLGVADRRPTRFDDEHDLGWRGALTVGLAQVLALVPGTSRSGITITAALFLGASRQAAARFSFLLAIPLLALAGGYEMLLVSRGEAVIQWREFGLSFTLSAASALACIHLFLRLVDRVGMMPFVVYRLAMAAVLVVLFW